MNARRLRRVRVAACTGVIGFYGFGLWSAFGHRGLPEGVALAGYLACILAISVLNARLRKARRRGE